MTEMPTPAAAGREPGGLDRRLRAVVDRSPAVTAIVDVDGRICYLSPAAAALTGSRPGDRPRLDLIHPDDREAAARALSGATLAPGEPTWVRYRVCSGSDWRHVEGTYTDLTADPDVRGVVLTASDVTDRHRAEQELRERLRVEETMSRVSRLVIDRGGADDLDAIVDEGLRLAASLGDASRALVIRTDDDGATWNAVHEWCHPGSTPIREGLRDVDGRALGWSVAELRHEGRLVITSADRLPDAAGPEREVLDELGVGSTAVVAMRRGRRLVGALSLATRDDHEWTPVVLSALEQLALVLTTAIDRAEVERARRQAEETLRDNEARFRDLLHHSSDWIMVLARDGTISFSSPAGDAIVGRTAEHLLGTTPVDLVHPDDLEEVIRAVDRVQSGRRTGEPVTIRLRHADGHWVPVEVLGNDLGADGIVVNIRDRSESVRVAATLREAEVRFRQVFEHAPIGMSLEDADGRFLRVNPAFARMLGRTQQEMVGTTFREHTHPDDLPRNLAAHGALFAGEHEEYTLEKRYRHADGHWVWIRVSASVLRGEDGAVDYAIGHFEDVTETRRLLDRLEHEATHDTLTGLPLRNLLLDHLDLALASARRSGEGVAVLFVDLDNFKRVNDSLGHTAGDELLVSVAERVRGSLREVDTAGRFGGDEFVVICPGLHDVRDARVIAERIRGRLSDPFAVRGVEVHVGASIGIAAVGGADARVLDPVDDAPEELLRRADTAAYRAKERGRNRLEIYDESLRQEVEERLATESALRHGVEHGELRLRYHPLVDARTGRLDGFEALVRWQRPGHGLVDPAVFLPLAEDTGLIVPLGRRVLALACEQLARWQAVHPDLRLSVNLSARELASVELVDDVADTLVRTGVDPRGLCLEITETVLVPDADVAVSTLHSLRALGVDLAIDDFGTGYSSLGYLRQLPVSQLKIDQSFVQEICDGPDDVAIVASVVQMAHALDLEVVAEGVETSEQAARLRSLGCDLLQGFWFSLPVDAEAASEALDRANLVLPAELEVRPAAGD